MDEITQQEAMDLLDLYFSRGGKIPMYDCVVYRYNDIIRGVYIEYTFRYLIKIACNLTDIVKK